ncbi:MAG: TIGR02996 domain-containing protein [Fimbriiglobus sp.]
MPWFQTRLPPSPGVIRGIAPSELVVWTEHGLFRFETGSMPCVRMLHGPTEAEEKFDPTTGVMRWGRERYNLFGDPAFVPNTSLVPTLKEEARDDRPPIELRVDRKRRRVEVLEAGEVVTTITDFPAVGDRWHFAGVTGWRSFVLAGPSGFRRYHHNDPPAPPPPPPPPVVSRWAATDYGLLLAGVVAAPDDDLPRLVLADWLEERGEESDVARAEFIRLQCRIAERERTAPVPEGDPDREREKVLLDQYQSDWLRDLPVIRGIEWPRYGHGWWRGFPSVSVQSVTTLERSYAKLVKASPIEMVIFWNRSKEPRGFSGLAGSRLMESLRVLSLTSYGYDHNQELEPFRELLANPWLKQLRGLVLDSCSTDSFPALAEAQHLDSLEWLNLSLDHETATVLASATGMPALQWLQVRRFNSSETPESQAALQELRKRFRHVEFNS